MSGYAIKPVGFMIDTSRLMVSIMAPFVTADGRMVLYDVDHEGLFTQACTALARDLFRSFAKMYLVMPGSRSNFILERILPNYSMVLFAASELVFDDKYQHH